MYLFTFMPSKKTHIYIDGFNLYYGSSRIKGTTLPILHKFRKGLKFLLGTSMLWENSAETLSLPNQIYSKHSLLILVMSACLFQTIEANSQHSTSKASGKHSLVIETNVDAALAKAKISKQPVLIIISHPEMPGCKLFHQNIITDQGVRQYLDETFVVVEIDARTPTAEMFHQKLHLVGLPAFVLADANKNVRGNTCGAISSPAFFLGQMKNLINGIDSTVKATTPTECNDPEFLKGCEFLNKGEPQAAIGSFTEAIKGNPKLWEAYLNRGTTYCGLKNYDKALADMNKALEINPNCFSAHVNKGSILDETGKPHEAIVEYGEAIKIDPDNPEGFFNRAVTQIKLKSYEQAKNDLNNAMQLYKKRGNQRMYLESISRLEQLAKIQQK